MWGRHNSVTIMDSSAQTAADIEFANFLTRNYFERRHLLLLESPFFSNRTCLLSVCAMGKEAAPE